MRPSARAPARPAAALALLAALAGGACASGPAARDAFYRLEAGAPPGTLAAPALPGTLVVERLRADALSGERALLYRDAPDAVEVRRHAYHLWVDPPPAMLQRELAGYLRRAGVAERVATPEQRARPDFVLAGRLLRLERVLGSPPRVALELELSLTREPGAQLVLFELYREEVEAAGDGVEPAVLAFDRALAAIFARLLADLSRS